MNQPEVFVYKNKEGEEYVLQEHCDYNFHEDGEKFLETIWKCVQCGNTTRTRGDVCPPVHVCKLFRVKKQSDKVRRAQPEEKILTRGEANRAQSVQQGTISLTKGNDTRKTNASPTLPKTQ